jgi:hypothetical protein
MRIFALLTLLIISACSSGLFDYANSDPRSMPTRLSMAIPLSMLIEDSNQGTAAAKLREGAMALQFHSMEIDSKLQEVSYYEPMFMEQQGTRWEHHLSGDWVYYTTNQQGGYYLYSGKNTDSTNMYLTWQREPYTGLYTGELLLYPDEDASDLYTILVSFDQRANTLAFHLDRDDSYTRIILTAMPSGRMSAQAFYDEDFTDAESKKWYLKAFAGFFSSGGVAAENSYVYEGSCTEDNFRYEEYYTGTGSMLWKKGLFDCDGVPQEIPEETETGGVGAPSDLKTILDAIAFPAPGSFPEVALP